jgi:thiol:disulfide interchange protein DsbA
MFKALTSSRFTGIAVTAIAAVALVAFATSAKAESDYREGFHYTDHGTQLTDRPVVTEYISVFCPACNYLNGFEQELRQSIPQGIPKRRAHVDFIRGTDMNGLIGVAKVIALMEIHGQQLKTDPVDDLFDAIHKHRSKLNVDVINQVIEMHDEMNPDFDVEAAFQSKEVNQLAMASTQNQRRMQQAGVLTSVPTLMVNGRYQINLQNLDGQGMFGANGEINRLVSYLTAKDYSEGNL